MVDLACWFGGLVVIMSRQLPIGESSYIPKSRMHHQKFILIGRRFDRHIVTLSRCAFNTTVFNICGEVGRYVGKVETHRFYGMNSLDPSSVNYQKHGSLLPALFWESVTCK